MGEWMNECMSASITYLILKTVLQASSTEDGKNPDDLLNLLKQM